MEKVIWSDSAPDYGHSVVVEAGGLDAARGLIIGLAISQVFWVAVAFFVF